MAPGREPGYEGYLMTQLFKNPQTAYTFEEIMAHFKKVGKYVPPPYEISATLTTLIQESKLIICASWDPTVFGPTPGKWILKFVRP